MLSGIEIFKFFVSDHLNKYNIRYVYRIKFSKILYKDFLTNAQIICIRKDILARAPCGKQLIQLPSFKFRLTDFNRLMQT